MSLIRKHGAVLQAWACLDLVFNCVYLATLVQIGNAYTATTGCLLTLPLNLVDQANWMDSGFQVHGTHCCKFTTLCCDGGKGWTFAQLHFAPKVTFSIQHVE